MGRDRYIVVAFKDGIGYAYNINGQCHWALGQVKIYSRKMAAFKRAYRCKREYINDKVVVYNIKGVQGFSCSDFKNWDDRIVYEIGK